MFVTFITLTKLCNIFLSYKFFASQFMSGAFVNRENRKRWWCSC